MDINRKQSVSRMKKTLLTNVSSLVSKLPASSASRKDQTRQTHTSGDARDSNENSGDISNRVTQLYSGSSAREAHIDESKNKSLKTEGKASAEVRSNGFHSQLTPQFSEISQTNSASRSASSKGKARSLVKKMQLSMRRLNVRTSSTLSRGISTISSPQSARQSQRRRLSQIEELAGVGTGCPITETDRALLDAQPQTFNREDYEREMEIMRKYAKSFKPPTRVAQNTRV